MKADADVLPVFFTSWTKVNLLVRSMANTRFDVRSHLHEQEALAGFVRKLSISTN